MVEVTREEERRRTQAEVGFYDFLEFVKVHRSEMPKLAIQ